MASRSESTSYCDTAALNCLPVIRKSCAKALRRPTSSSTYGPQMRAHQLLHAVSHAWTSHHFRLRWMVAVGRHMRLERRKISYGKMVKDGIPVSSTFVLLVLLYLTAAMQWCSMLIFVSKPKRINLFRPQRYIENRANPHSTSAVSCTFVPRLLSSKGRLGAWTF